MTAIEPTTWFAVGPQAIFPADCGTAVLVQGQQVAVFNSNRKWYAVQNECPHNRQMVLSRGLMGDHDRTAKVTCPLHKNSFSLEDGHHLGGNEAWCLKTYPIKVEAGVVFIGLEEGGAPPRSSRNAASATPHTGAR